MVRVVVIFVICVLALPANATDAVRPQLRPEVAVAGPVTPAYLRPRPRREALPRTRWWALRGTDVWTRAAEAALMDHGKALPQATPTDIEAWCPAYPQASEAERRAFWVGLLSTLAKHESTYRPAVSGDSGLSHGLLQIRTGTARLYGCRATYRAALLDPTENLSCAIRIMARTVTRDNAVARRADGRRGGAGADWGPFVQSSKRADMRRWVSSQPYCTPLEATRPRLRPAAAAE
ncbi:MAG: transglycosylase SLT domain-containing protein [Pseudomonadota bacterium]